MNYTVPFTMIKQNWFDGENNKFICIGHKALYLYFSLFKFKLHDEKQNRHRFIFNIELLKDETGYNNQVVLDSLISLQKNKILNSDVKRWDRINNHFLIISEAIDIPKGEWKDYKFYPKDENNRFINIDFQLIDHYIRQGLNERHISVYCLLSKMSNNVERKSWVGIQTISEILGYSKNTVSKLIREMNEKRVLYSRKKYTGKGNSYEHHLCRSFKDLSLFSSDSWISKGIDDNIKNWKKKR